MKEIKFSHWYTKMDGVLVKEDMRAKLLQVFTCNAMDLSADLISFDTQFYLPNEEGFGFFALPKGEVLFLLFKAEITDKLFCTIRRWTKEKQEYYMDSVGETFNVVLTSEADLSLNPSPSATEPQSRL